MFFLLQTPVQALDKIRIGYPDFNRYGLIARSLLRLDSGVGWVER